MQTNISNLVNDVLNNGRMFLIPVYQRNYSWREQECKVLFDDIMEIYNGNYKKHFIGSVVWKPENGNSNNLNIIDGQQRITTMFLICKALLDISDDQKTNDKLKGILIDDYKEVNRLTLIKSDNITFEKILNNKLDQIENKNSRVYQNYQYFKRRLIAEKVNFRDFFLTLDELQVIRIELAHEDDAQIIFESINSTGLSLSIADLIRNFLLMNENYDHQKYLFETYWYQFEEKLGLEKLVMFFEHYLNIKTKKTNVNRANMYTIFKEHYVTNNFQTEVILKEFERYIKQYQFLVNPEIDYQLEDIKLSKRLNQLKRELITLDNNVVNMFLMQILYNHQEGDINQEEVVYTFELVLTYIFRRGIVGLANSSLQKVFRYLYNQVNDNLHNFGFNKSLNYALITSKDNSVSRFPRNEEFFDSLSTRNLYGKYKKLNYLLSKLENYNNKTIIDIEQSEITIEHIMPQTLNKEWKEQLGENYKQLQEENVNDLGNLTLTSYNSKLSNNYFDRKKEILNSESHLMLNESLKNIDQWTVAEIEKRGKELASIGLEIWSYPGVDQNILQEVENNKYNQITFGELINNYMSIKFIKMIINNDIDQIIYKIKTFRDLFSAIISYAYGLDSIKFEDLFVDNIEYQRTRLGNKFYIFSKDKSKVNEPKLCINNIIYFAAHGSGPDILKQSLEILEEYDIDPESITFKYYK